MVWYHTYCVEDVLFSLTRKYWKQSDRHSCHNVNVSFCATAFQCFAFHIILISFLPIHTSPYHIPPAYSTFSLLLDCRLFVVF
jgi:hypothetical protein